MIGPTAEVPAQQQSSTIPIVVVGGPNPLDSTNDPTTAALEQSLVHPGRNVTGNSFGPATAGIKSVELLKTALPGLARLGINGWRERIDLCQPGFERRCRSVVAHHVGVHHYSHPNVALLEAGRRLPS